MLIQKPIDTNDVIALRLCTGEEVIGRFTEENDTSITISKPIMINLRMVSSGEAAISFGPFMVSPDESAKFVVLKSALMTRPLRVREDIKGNYIQMTSGIATAAAPHTSPILRA